MLRAELCVGSLLGFGLSFTDQSNAMPNSLMLIPNSSLYVCQSYRFSLQLFTLRSQPVLRPSRNKFKSTLISCNKQQTDDEFLEASLLISETVKHYHLRKHGFREEVKQFSGQFVPFSAQVSDQKADVNSIGLGILRRFQNPTIFLKISCEGDFLLPIVVGEFAIEKLIDSLDEGDHGNYPNQFQFVRNIVDELQYEVKMVKITKRVVHTYFARIYFGKVGEKVSFSVDARPSDAINVAKRCKAPIYVNKQIVLTDAIRIAYGTGRVRGTNPIYDVLLDSPIEGPDLLVEELSLVQNMELAIKEERYKDAAMWRDKLLKLRNSGL